MDRPKPEASGRVAVLLIGDELLSGRTRDINLQTIAAALAPLGLQVGEARIVSDDHERIVAAVRALSGAYRYLFTTGGIGPTHDDITAQAVADAMGAELEINDQARAVIEARHGGALNEARLRRGRIPAGASLIANPVSGAPGFQIGNVFVMAGVPKICEAMLGDVLPRLEGGELIVSVSVAIPGAREGDIAAQLGRLADELQEAGANISIGSYPYFRSVADHGVELVARGAPGDALDDVQAQLQAIAARRDETD